MVRRAASSVWIGVVLGSVMAGDARGQACLEPAEMPRVTPHPDEERFLEDFGAAFRRFKSISLEDFRAEHKITEPVERSDGSGVFWRRRR